MSSLQDARRHAEVAGNVSAKLFEAALDEARADERARLTQSEHWRLVRCSIDLLATWGTRTEQGEEITVEWGEPDADGIYEPVFTIHRIQPLP